MNIKRILSSALVALMIFTSCAALIPVRADAAHHTSVSENTKTNLEVAQIVTDYQAAEFATAEEMFEYDLNAGYLDHSTNGTYSIYVNRYTGVLYYRNNVTKEMLTSNSYNFDGYSGAVEALTSQLYVIFSRVSSTEKDERLYSSTWSATKNQINVTKINNGLRVSYAIGETATRFLLPEKIEMKAFEEHILRPMMDTLYEKLVETIGEKNCEPYFGDTYYNPEKIATDPLIHKSSISKYDTYVTTLTAQAKRGIFGEYDDEMKRGIAEVTRIKNSIMQLLSAYSPHTKTVPVIEDLPESLKDASVYYIPTRTNPSMKAVYADVIKSLCPNYTFDMMYADEDYCAHVREPSTSPVFRCSLEYSFNEDGSLSVRLPSNSISFDETKYILKSITPLQYFGAGNFRNDGYFFIPDGSGSVIDFADFRNSNVSMSSALSIYGTDYCYSEITGAHKQPLTMPVYGIVSQVESANGLQSTGYFAILEEGASMASLDVIYNKSSFRDGTVYSTFTPYPTDKFDLSDTISVGSNQYYSMVSESKYTGSYVTRYVMLSNNKVAGAKNYAPSYVGMAEYYRDYLYANGTLTNLENVSDDLPLYIEALGSMEVMEKILTFPVKVSKAITTFEDLVTMYEELGRAKEIILDKADEYQALADAEEDDLDLKEVYLNTAERYRQLAEKIVNIDNVNFKLTGFANGGMYFTYPSRVKWERVVGGKKGFKELLEKADEYTDEDSNFGVYPDFDFQYINNVELFDGVGKNNTVSRMVDNRYASRQVYSSITGEYDTIYAMLVSADALDRLYEKFNRKYSKYDVGAISVSTLGSDLNSNFDEDNPVSRDDAQNYVTDLLDRMANESNYSVMISQGNMYAVKYADHILGVCTDSSYYRYSSYTVPFTGMVLHGFVNYTGGALNYSGSPDYDILRSIENGAAPYYVLGYNNENVNLMKDDEELNKYYSVSYVNWYDDIVEKYAILNAQLGDIQDYKIVDHKILIGERVIDESEEKANLNAIKAEFISVVRDAIGNAISAAQDDMYENGYPYGMGINLKVDVAELVEYARLRCELDAEANLTDVNDALVALVNEYKADTNIDETNGYLVEVGKADILDYKSSYEYVTGSLSTDKDYVKTDYTVDNDLIVLVTYQNEEGKTRTFVLNYNIYSVRVRLSDNQDPIEIGKYGFARIDN